MHAHVVGYRCAVAWFCTRERTTWYGYVSVMAKSLAAPERMVYSVLLSLTPSSWPSENVRWPVCRCSIDAVRHCFSCSYAMNWIAPFDTPMIASPTPRYRPAMPSVCRVCVSPCQRPR